MSVILSLIPANWQYLCYSVVKLLPKVLHSIYKIPYFDNWQYFSSWFSMHSDTMFLQFFFTEKTFLIISKSLVIDLHFIHKCFYHLLSLVLISDQWRSSFCFFVFLSIPKLSIDSERLKSAEFPIYSSILHFRQRFLSKGR